MKQLGCLLQQRQHLTYGHENKQPNKQSSGGQTNRMASMHYALVSKPGCTPLTISNIGGATTTTTTIQQQEQQQQGGEDMRQHDDNFNASGIVNNTVVGSNNNNIRSELTTIYQRYADMYPNPKLLEEVRQRDVLLQAASAARNYEQQQQMQQQQQEGGSDRSITSNKRSKSSGFQSFLFGRDRSNDNTNDNSKDVIGSGGQVLTPQEEEELLRYTDILPTQDDETTSYVDESLCGTKLSIDESCIPSEAYSVARLHLSSAQSRRQHPNTLRYGPTAPGSSSSGSSYDNNNNNKHRPMMVVVGIGEIAIFDAGCSNSDHDEVDPDKITRSTDDVVDDETTEGGYSQVMLTSDRDVLIDYAQRTQEFSLDAVRGTILSPTCIAISWGFMDGITIFYQRIVFPPTTASGSSKGRGMGIGGRNSDGARDGFDGWEAVWMLGPSGPVLESMTGDAKDFFHDNDEQPGSPLLRVSDCLVLSVETAPFQLPSDIDNQSQNVDNTSAITLALSRLGGYIELVPIPRGLWSGSVLTPENYKRQKQHPPKRKRGQPQPHYATGRNIACPPQTLALTTLDYQLDVQCLDAFRTCVNSETVWNSQAFPEAPPGEFILVAAGGSKETIEQCTEVLTFWSISTIFPDEPVDPSQDEIGFQLHSSLVEVISADAGPEVSVFATDDIMRRWRRPRLVELRGSHETGNSSTESSSQSNRQVTSLSARAPIVKLRFSTSDGSTSTFSGPFLSILDWNGGVQVFDCSIMGRYVAQNMPLHEYEQLQNQEQEPFPLVKVMISRSEFATELTRHAKSLASNFDWLDSTGFGMDAQMPPLILLLRKYSSLVVTTCRLPSEGLDHGPTPSFGISSLNRVSFPSKNAAMQSSSDDSMAFVTAHLGTNRDALQSLKFCVMEQLQPVAIVKMLAKESKYEDAILSARTLTDYEQSSVMNIIADCRRHVWKKRLDVESLKETDDAVFIVKEATSLCVPSSSDILDISWDAMRPILKLGLASAENLGDGNSADTLRRAIVQLGTFELLCQYFGSTPSLDVFQNDFATVNVMELTTQTSERGDVGALSILIFRHRQEIANNLLSILSALPLSLDPLLYCHLLPVVRNGRISDLFIRSNDSASHLPWSHMPQYLFERDSTAIVVDLFDEKMVLDLNKTGVQVTNSSTNLGQRPIDSLAADWFVARAKSVQSFLGQEGNVTVLCELGLSCLTPGVEERDIHSAPPEVQQLYKTWRSSQMLQQMLVDGIVSIDGDRIVTEDLLNISVRDLLDLILEGEMDASLIIKKFQDYIQPLLFETADQDRRCNIDKDLEAFCLKEVQKCREISTAEPELSISLAKRALATSSAIAQSSKSSFCARDRLIKDTKALIELVVTVIQQISAALGRVSLSLQQKEEMKNSMWNLYESLPVRDPGSSCSTEMDQVDDLYRALVRFDISSRWPGLQFTYQVDNQSMETVFIDLCKAFRRSVDKIVLKSERSSCLRDLLSDVKALNETCFQSSVPTGKIISIHIVPQLLEKRDFDLLAEILSLDDSDFLKEEQRIENGILDFIDDAVFSAEGESDDSVAAAIKCHEAIGHILPSLEAKFQSVRRYLDASHFIASVIFEGTDAVPLKPFELKSLSPFDAVEKVMTLLPQSVICGSPQWMNDDFSRDANSILREAASSRSPTEEGVELPVLPGGAIFHLAMILQLEDNASVVAVKCRVIHFALKCRFFGAASAIARTLFSDSVNDTHSDTFSEPSDCAKLDAVAKIVSTKDYTDSLTKAELCDSALCHCQSKISESNSKAFDKILEASFSLNVAMSRFNVEFQQISPERRERLLGRPIARLPKHILHEYNSDVFRLFNDLIRQTKQGVVHDELVNTLSMFHFYWIIFDAQESKTRLDEICRADASANLDLACSLVLHIPSSGTAFSCVNKLQNIAGDQIAAVSSKERFQSDTEFIVPDPDIIRRLVGRGYSENASVRAVTMTQNAGYDEALSWAVIHTMDPNFNDPLVLLKQGNRRFIDESAIQKLQKSLYHLEQVLGDPTKRVKLIRSISSRPNVFSPDQATANQKPLPGTKQTIGINGTSIPRNAPQAKPRTMGVIEKADLKPTGQSSLPHHKPSLSVKATPKSSSAPSRLVVPVQFPQVAAQPPSSSKTQTITPETTSAPAHLAVPAQSPSVAAKHQSNLKTQGVTRPPPQIAATRLNPQAARPVPQPPAGPPPVPSQDRSIPIPIGSSNGTVRVLSTGDGRAQAQPPNREELRKSGEALRAQLRSHQTEDSTRRRLIEDGRKLFLQARKTPKLVVPPGSTLQATGENGVAAPQTTKPPVTRKPVAPTPAAVKVVPVHKAAKKLSTKVAKIEGDAAESWDFNDDFDDL